MSEYLTIVDYGLGNFHSLQSALSTLDLGFAVDTDGSQIEKANILILPGVAAFGASLSHLRDRNQLDGIRQHLASGKKLLGICVGAQLMQTTSEENPGVIGLELFSGRVRKLDFNKVRVPNQGWYRINALSSRTFIDQFHGCHFYFSHSYIVPRESVERTALATIEFAESGAIAAFATDQVVGIQFHPEKSGVDGLKFIQSAIRHLGGGYDVT
jgi:glutamine amidotransferase